MRSVFIRLAGATLMGGVCACAQLTGLSDLEIASTGDDDASAPIDATTTDAHLGNDGANPIDAHGGDDGAPTTDAAGDDAGDDAAPIDAGGSDAPPPRDAGTDAGPLSCVSKAGPALVAINGQFCIDATEVTNDQYTAFLNASPALTLAPSPACAFKTSFAPSTAIPVGKGTNPVVWVDWCDAYAYCAWAGKHLCGAIGGGPSSKANVANKSVDEWYVACSADGANVYPYGGNAYVQGKCNDSEAKTNGTRTVGSFTGCQGGYSGIYDMNGNAYEWVDACDVSAGAADACMIRGGSWYFTGSGYGGCNTYFNDYTVERQNSFNDTGFRCCEH